MASPPTSIKPTQYMKETLLGMTRSLEQRYGVTPRNDLSTTLNTKFNVFASRLPQNDTLVKYFTWGNGGRLNEANNLASAQYVKGTNMSLYSPRPFRAVPFEQDLTAVERANYAMRVVTTINGQRYCLYYLKKIDFTQSTIQYIRKDPISGVSTSYELNPNDLNPTPPVADSNGVITDVADSVSVVLPAQIVLTGQEVLESISVLDGGDPRYANVSEIGFVSASTESVSVADATGTQFSYNEAILAQLTDHTTLLGMSFNSTQDVFKRSISFSMQNLIVQS